MKKLLLLAGAVLFVAGYFNFITADGYGCATFHDWFKTKAPALWPASVGTVLLALSFVIAQPQRVKTTCKAHILGAAACSLLIPILIWIFPSQTDSDDPLRIKIILALGIPLNTLLAV